jgi:hypothetical protein
MSNKHIVLLSDREITDLYSRPDFNQHERALYFTLNEDEAVALNHYSNIKTRLFFILQLGYFKAKQQFFKFDLVEVKSDVNYIISNFFHDNTDIGLSWRLSRDYITRQKNDILKLFAYNEWSSKCLLQVESHLCELLRYYPKSHSALRQLLTYFDSQKITLPHYRALQDIFTAAFSAEQNRIANVLLDIPPDQKKQLSDLIKRKDGISKLNIIRADQKNFHCTAVRAEVEKAQSIVLLYTFCKEFIPTLKLSKNAVHYYADIAAVYCLTPKKTEPNTTAFICYLFYLSSISTNYR